MTLRATSFLALALLPLALAAPARAQEPAAGLDRSTPRAALRTFILAARDHDWDRAARVLSPDATPPGDGPRRARQLKVVLDQELWVDFSTVSDAPDGDIETVGVIRAGGEPVPIELVRRRAEPAPVWTFSARTTAAIPQLYAAHGPTWIEGLLPEVFSRVRIWELELWQLLGLFVALLLGYLGGIAVAATSQRIGRRVTRRTRAEWDDQLVRLMKGPTRFLVAIVLSFLLIELLHLAAPAQEVVNKILLVGLIGALAWFGVRGVRFVADRVERSAMARVEANELDELALRGLRTQVVVLRRVASIVVGIVAAALMLVQFEVVRTVGMSLLASAGIAGVVLGLAAQRSIATLLAGLQLSITQPIRIGDTVIVEGEWGTIEEINLTYVVVKIWDQRRLIVPMNRFLEQPFENWTKVSPALLGTVFFHADYRLPIDAVREELDRILEGNPRWDGRVKSVLVTDATERTVQVRALVSAADAGDQWDLRCEVREKLIAFLQRYEDGKYLPRVRVDDAAEGSAAVAG